MSENERWTFPDVDLGDDVLVASDPTLSDFTYAKVTRILKDAQTIDAIAFLPRGGTRFFFQCWERNDPRIEAASERFHDGGSGVFELTEGTKRQKTIMRRMDDMEQRIVTLDAHLDAMELSHEEFSQSLDTEKDQQGRLSVLVAEEPEIADFTPDEPLMESMPVEEIESSIKRRPGRPRKIPVFVE